MKSLAGKNTHNIKIDLAQSEGSYLYDANRGRSLLDLHGFYSTLPLGYNHPIFSSAGFQEEILRAAAIKIPTGGFSVKEAEQFEDSFIDYAPEEFVNFYYCCTGALAVEMAIKAAAFYKTKGRNSFPKIISLKNSFHGINSWGCFVSSRSVTGSRLNGLPKNFSIEVEAPGITYEGNEARRDSKEIERSLFEIEEHFKRVTITDPIVGVLVEPIQSTAGDVYFPSEFFTGLRKLCDIYDIPLIFDEVQTGFCATGEKWYYQHLGIIPDIVAFGKKSQISGIMATEKLEDIFLHPGKLSVTWDGTLVDMIRCKYIVKAYEDYDILGNVGFIGNIFNSGLKLISGIQGIRSCGNLLAFDLISEEARDNFVSACVDLGLLVNKGGKTSVRLRPNLCIDAHDVDRALDIIDLAIKKEV